MYLGNSSDKCQFTYFLPLLPVWKTMAKAEYSEKLKLAENLQLIKIVSKNDNCDFPNQAKVLFSHSGFQMIYQTLSTGDTCLCVKNISTGAKDEVDRDIPFTILMTASGDESIKILDDFVMHYSARAKELPGILADLFSYDPHVNGIKFNLALINKRVNEVPASNKQILHRPNYVVSLLVDSVSMVQTAFNELGLSPSRVYHIADINGNSSGSIQFKEIPVEVVSRHTGGDEKDATNDGDPTAGTAAATAIPDANNELKSALAAIQETLSSHTISIRRIQEHLTNSNIEEKLDRLSKQVEDVRVSPDTLSIVAAGDGEIAADTITISRVQLWLLGIALTVGFLLGSLIF